MNTTDVKMLSSVDNKRQVRFVVYINDNEFRSEWSIYNAVEMANKTQALVQNGHTFTIEVK